MTCQSSESTETIESDRRADNNTAAVESDESRIAAAMKELRNTGRKDLRLHSLQRRTAGNQSPAGGVSILLFFIFFILADLGGGTSKLKRLTLVHQIVLFRRLKNHKHSRFFFKA